MKIYRIYKIVSDFEWSTYADDMIQVDRDETIKYVDSRKKADEFIKQIEEHNKSCEHCYNCPIIRLTKRKYNNQKDEVDSYCSNQNLFFDRNSVFCENEKEMEFDDYYYEEIEVE